MPISILTLTILFIPCTTGPGPAHGSTDTYAYGHVALGSSTQSYIPANHAMVRTSNSRGHAVASKKLMAGMQAQGQPTDLQPASAAAGSNELDAASRAQEAAATGVAVQQANKCDKCNVPVANGGCKCNSDCDCVSGASQLVSPGGSLALVRLQLMQCRSCTQYRRWKPPNCTVDLLI
jgi:hypothetical protein